MSDMETLKAEMQGTKELCKKFEELIKAEMAKGTEQIDTHELYEAVDMMKDCAEIVEKKAKTAYYCSVVKAMEDAKEDDKLREKIMELSEDDERRFYNSNRYSDGSYAPVGYGNRSSRRGYDYVDYRDREPMYYDGSRMNYSDNRMMPRERMYYDGSMSNGSSSANSSGNNAGSSSSVGYGGSSRTYTESRYDRARRNYTDSKQMHNSNSPEDKQANMKELEKYMQELSADMTEMIENASPEEKTLLKNKLNVLTQKI